MVRIFLSEVDLPFAEEVVHRVSVLIPGTEPYIDGGLFHAKSEGFDKNQLLIAVHDQFLQCRLAAQNEQLRRQLYERLLR